MDKRVESILNLIAYYKSELKDASSCETEEEEKKCQKVILSRTYGY